MAFLFCQGCGRWLGARHAKCPDCGAVSWVTWKYLFSTLYIELAIGALTIFAFWLTGHR